MTEQPLSVALIGRAFRPSTQDDDSVSLMVHVLDMQDQALPIQRLRDWALDAVQVIPGRRVADLGSGTGTMTRRLAELAHPGGTVLGVEPNPVLRRIAEERASNAGSYAEFVDGLAGALPFADESLDLVWCERVLQHVPDAQAAVADIARVLKPGGRAVLLDADHGSRVIAGVDPDVIDRLNATFMRSAANPRAARMLPQQVLAAGLELDPDVGSAALVFVNDDEQLRLLRGVVDAALAEGTVDQAEADQAMRDYQRSVEEGWAFAAVTVFGFVATKPRA